jgi:hypothetical protein
MASSLDALRGLTSNVESADNPIQGYLLRQKRIEEMKHNAEQVSGSRGRMTMGATAGDLEGLEQSQVDDPYAGHKAQAEIAYKQPEAIMRRDQDYAQKMQLAGEPARVAGEANVRAANVAGDAKYRALQEMLTAGGAAGDRRISVAGVGSVGPDPSVAQGARDAAAAARQTTAGNQRGLVERLKALTRGTNPAPAANRPGGIGGWLGGNSAARDAEVASILGQLNGGQSETGGTVAMVAPDGRELNVPADRVAEMEAAGATRQ